MSTSKLNIYSVNQVPMPATVVQNFTLAQLLRMEEIFDRPDFQRWAVLCLTPEEYVNNWRRGQRGVVYLDKNDRYHFLRINQDGTIAKQVPDAV